MLDMLSCAYNFVVTTQGPTYPPSEVMDQDGNFVVIGNLNLQDNANHLYQEWGGAFIAATSPLPNFGGNQPYTVIKRFDWKNLDSKDDCILHTLPWPIPCHNYPMVFSPEQKPAYKKRCSLPFHEAFIPDFQVEQGRKLSKPIMLSDWIKAQGELEVSIIDGRKANFNFEFSGLIPDSLYTVMALREKDLNPIEPTRPGPLGVPNVFISNLDGKGTYQACLPNPFPVKELNKNRIISIVLLWMSSQMNYGGAIGQYGLGVDIHAQLKLPGRFFDEFETHE